MTNDKWLSQILGNYKLTTTTSTQYRTKLLHEYTIYKSCMYQADPDQLYTQLFHLYLSVNTYTNIPAT